MNFGVDMCRVCLQSGANTSIFNSNGSEQFYIQIMLCTSVEITADDGLPAVLCNNCIMNLNISFNFKHLCETSDLRLRNILSQNSDFKIADIEPDKEKLGLAEYELKDDNEIQTDINFALDDLNETISYNEKTDVKTEFLESNTETKTETNEESSCNKKTLRRVGRIQKEKNSQTENLESYSCEFCSKKFKAKKILDRHQDLCSNNPMQLTCKICNKSFKDKYILSRHSRLHNGPKPLKPKRHMCDLCGHTFHDQYGLNMHKRCHSGQRPFVCSICGHGFSQQSNMERHIKAKHEKVRPFQCTICLKEFAYSYVLTEHHKTHTGEKDHECGVCSRKFAKKFALNRHMLTHTLERPFKCKLCERTYTQSNDLKAHIRRAHEKIEQKIQIDLIQIHVDPMIPNTEKLPVL